MFISNYHIVKINSDSSKVAVVDLTLNHCFVIKNIKLLYKNGSRFITMPSRKKANGSFEDIAFPINQSVRSVIENLVYAGYDFMVSEEKDNIYFYTTNKDKNAIHLQDFSDFYSTDYFCDDTESRKNEEINIDNVKVHAKNKMKLCAVCTVLLENELVIRNIKLITKSSGEMLMVMPYYQLKGRFEYKNIAYPVNTKMRKKLEITLFTAYYKLSNSDKIKNLGAVFKSEIDSKTMVIDDQKKLLFDILWNNSESGYLLQSRITPILNNYGFEWKKIFGVNTVAELAQKVDFLKIRKVETRPNIFVDWIVVSIQNKVSPKVVKSNVGIQLTTDVISSIHNVLYTESKNKEGNMLMSDVVPVLEKNAPDLFNSLPNVKISHILKECDFVKQYMVQNSDTSFQAWVHIEPPQDRKATIETILSPVVDISLVTNNKTKNDIKKDRLGKIITALNNPFQHVPNSVFWPEHRILPNGVKRDDFHAAIKNLGQALKNETVGRFELDVMSWVSKLIYVKNTMVIDLIHGGYISYPKTFKPNLSNVGNKLLKMYQYNLVNIYRFGSVNENGDIISKGIHRIFTITNYGHNQLKDIGRESNFNTFMVLQDADAIKQKLSINQWLIKCITLFRYYITRYALNQMFISKTPTQNWGRINAFVECNCQPIFAQSIRRGNDWEDMKKTGEFYEKFQRIINLILHYTDIYYNNNRAEFLKKPIFVFVAEDFEHCREIFQIIKKIIYVSSKNEMLAEIWFCNDLDVYNHFLSSHFSFNEFDVPIPINLSEKFNIDKLITDEVEVVIEDSI